MPTPLETFLSQLHPGPVEDVRAVEELLKQEWGSFRGSSAESTWANKLSGRTESMSWHPPFLSFNLERHGATVNGSTRAAIHEWKLDIVSRSAEVVTNRHRQIYPASKPLDVSPIAKKVAKLIINERPSKSLKRYPDGRVKVLISEFINGRSERTIMARRKRFRKALEKILTPAGWIATVVNTYVKSPPRPQPADGNSGVSSPFR